MSRFRDLSWFIRTKLWEDIDKNGPPLKGGVPDNHWYDDDAYVDYAAQQYLATYGEGPHDIQGKVIEPNQTISASSGSRITVGKVLQIDKQSGRIQIEIQKRTPYIEHSFLYHTRIYPVKVGRKQWLRHPQRMLIV